MTTKHKTRVARYAVLEIIVGALIALLVWQIYSSTAAGIIFGITILFALSRTLIYRWFTLEFSKISEPYKLTMQIQELKDEEFFKEASAAEDIFIDCLHRLCGGTIVYDTVGKYILAAENQIEKTKKRMRAVALINPKEWVDGELEEYLKKQIDAIQRGLKVTRIFFLSNEDWKNEMVKQVIERQAEAGIYVYIAKKEEIKEEIKPFVIYDDDTAIVGNLGVERKITSGIKTIDPVRVNRLIDTFEHIKNINSEKYKNK